MATLGNALVSKILGHSDAEKAFRPWWDNFEDFLMYGLVMLGIIVAPTAIINSTPLDCNFCKNGNCDGKFGPDANYTQTDPDFNAWWIKKYCTYTAVDGFILYFPYLLLVMALLIVLIERGFVRIFNSGLNLDMFYTHLVKENLDSPPQSDQNDPNADGNLENSKTALEIFHSFINTRSNYFCSYLMRTILELVVAAMLLALLLVFGLPSIQNEEFVYCTAHGFFYECAGHPQQFYIYVLFIAIAILAVYVICCFFNLLWLIFPQLGSLSRVMRRYKQQLKKNSKDQQISDDQLLGGLYLIYYNNRDLKLLLDLLATSSGVAPSIRIMCLYDKNFRLKSAPSDVVVERSKPDSVSVQFGDAATIREIFGNITKLTCIYTVEISPPTPSSSVQAFNFVRNHDSMHLWNLKGDIEMQPLEVVNMKTEFKDLDPTKEYTIRVSTVVNGRAIASKNERVKAVECAPDSQNFHSMPQN